MKNNILILIVISAIAYILASFVFCSLNPSLWGHDQRGDIVGLVIFTWAVIVGARYCT